MTRQSTDEPFIAPFIEMMEQRVIPAKKANPSHKRLDGLEENSENHPRFFAYFQYNGRRLGLREDSYYAPLILAYTVAISGNQPFKEALTSRGNNFTLELQNYLRCPLQLLMYNELGKFIDNKLFYIYDS